MKKIFNNKGFTLVELIVVIAVIGVITVLLTPQFTSYIEKARIGTDKNAIGEVAHAAETAFVSINKNEDFTEMQIEISSKGEASYRPSVTTSDLVEGVSNIVSEDSYVYKSDFYRGQTVKITINATTGKAEIGVDETLSLSQILKLPELVDKYGKYIGVDKDEIDWELFDSNFNALIADADQFLELGFWDQIGVLKDVVEQSKYPCGVCGKTNCNVPWYTNKCSCCGIRH